MNSSFYAGNRKALSDRIEKTALSIVFSGKPPRKTNDEYYPFFTDRNFMYLTGIDQMDAVLMGDTLFIPPPDSHFERWNGERVKADKAEDLSGISDVKYSVDFEKQLNYALNSDRYDAVYLPLFKYTADEPDDAAYRLSRYICDRFPHIKIKNLMPHLKALRLIKQPCEIEAMRKAEEITRKGILAMMRAAKPGITELELRAEYYYTLMKNGCHEPSCPPIISAGKNNFCIHYHGHAGTANDGDMILNDVGASYNGIVTDVSRGWPVNGRFSEKQRLLYNCALETSDYMFEIIKPGMPMGDVDSIIRKINFEKLRSIGLCDKWEDIGKYMWHGGAHHVGFDVHDAVAVTSETPLAPGMVFCVDIGIYAEEWGIGFRLEDNCLVTKDGCENLSKDIPRSIEEIEAVMAN